MELFQWPEKKAITLVCQKKWAETSDCVSFILSADDSEILFDFIPGQFVSLGVNIDGELNYRAYSISSIPNTSSLQLTVKRVEGGKVSNYLVDHLAVGEKLEVLKPAGEFHLKQPHLNNMTLVSAGCGITPVMSMARTLLLDDDENSNIHFVHAAKSLEDIIYHQELLELEKKYQRFKLTIVLENAHNTHYAQGLLTQEKLTELCAGILETSVFLCGPVGFMKSVAESLYNLGMNMNNFYQESFTPMPVDDLNAEVSQSLVQTKEQVKVFVPSLASTTEVEEGSLLLDALEQAKLPIIAACRSGVCGSCKSQVVKGEYTRTSVETLTEQELADDYVLACSCSIATDVEVALNI